jgi:FkbM family methyltransferase
VQIIPILRNFYRRLRFRSLHRPTVEVQYEVLGTDYGGWPVIPALVSEGSLIYSFGTGEDVSFDLAMIERFGAHVHAFDPTPKAQEWIAGQDLPAKFQFHAFGVGPRDETMAFFPPADETHVSYSNAPAADQTRAPVQCDVRRVKTVMSSLGHEHVDVLKMDVEGFEYAVIADMMASGVRPTLVLVEFHHGMYDASDEDTCRAVSALEGAGYLLFHVSPAGREYGFVLKTAVGPARQ